MINNLKKHWAPIVGVAGLTLIALATCAEQREADENGFRIERQTPDEPQQTRPVRQIPIEKPALLLR